MPQQDIYIKPGPTKARQQTALKRAQKECSAGRWEHMLCCAVFWTRQGSDTRERQIAAGIACLNLYSIAFYYEKNGQYV